MSQVRILQRPPRVVGSDTLWLMHALLDLQRVDSAVLRLQRRRVELEGGADVRRARETCELRESELGEIRLASDEVARDQTRIEHEVAGLSAKADAERARLFGGSITNTRELEALQREIASLAERRSRLEDQLLELMERREELDARATVADAALAEARGELDRVTSGSAAELASIAAEEQAFASERAPIAAMIEPELLALYEELRASKHGVGAAALVEGTCQACNEHLSAMVLDRLRREQGVRRCEHCRRILIFA